MTQTQIYTVVDALMAIWQRKFLVVATFFAVLMLVGLITIFSEKTYLSDAKIFVRLGRENSALDATSGLGDRGVYALPFNRESEINSVAMMLESKELFGQVVDKIGPDRILQKKSKTSDSENPDDATSDDTDAKPSLVGGLMSFLASIGILNDIDSRERAIISLQRGTSITAENLSFIVTVINESYDPVLSQEIVSNLIDAYIKQYASTHRIDRGNHFLAEQVKVAEEKLKQSEKAFEDFKNRTRIMSVKDQRTVFINRIAKLENEILENDAQLRSAQSELDALTKIMETVPKSAPISQTEGAGNDAVDGMRQELFRLQVQREDLLARYQPSSPQVQRVEEQLKAARAIFEQTEAQMVERVEGPSRVYEGAKLQFIEKSPRLDALQKRSEVLQQQLDTAFESMAFFNDHETEFIRLQREFQLYEEDYQRLKRGMQQATMELAMQEQNLSNLSVFQPASFNPKPHRPKKLINLLGGIALGMIAGCSLAVLLDFRQKYFLQQPIDQAEDDLQLDLLVLADIPRQSPKTLLQADTVKVSH